MIDFIKVVKYVECKDKLFLGHCKCEAVYCSGWEKYSIEGCEKLDLWWNSSYAILKLQGSIMYYWQGHNWSYDKKEFCAAIEHINVMLGISLWNAVVEAFEYGAIFQVEQKPKEYIARHSVALNEKLVAGDNPKDKGNFKWWNGSSEKLKMYDAGSNIKSKQSKQRQADIMGLGWNPDGYYLKFEAHYLKPEMLNEEGRVLLADLLHPKMESKFKADLYNQYKRLVPMKTLIIPNNKKDLSTPDILMLVLAEGRINSGDSIQDIRNLLYDKINHIPDGVLSKTDKDNRKRQIKVLLERVNLSNESEWDLSEQLKDLLEQL